MLKEVNEGINEYLRTHQTESEQEYGNLMKNILSKPYLIPEVNPKVIKVILCSIGYQNVRENNIAYNKLIKEIKERENKVYTLVNPEMIEEYISKCREDDK